MACFKHVILLLIWILNNHLFGVIQAKVLPSKHEAKLRNVRLFSTKFLHRLHHRFRRSSAELNCSIYNTDKSPKAPDNRTKIHIGLLLPFVLSTHDSEYSRGGAKFYSEAFSIAVEQINKDATILPGYKLDFVFNDTRCNELDSIRAMYYQFKSRDEQHLPVHGFIGLGCQCSTAAKFASAMKVPLVSHVSFCYKSIKNI